MGVGGMSAPVAAAALLQSSDGDKDQIDFSKNMLR